MSAPTAGPSRPSSFRAQLAVWLSAVALLVLLVVGGYGGWQLLKATSAAGVEALHASARAAAELLGADLREREAEIYLLSNVPVLRERALDDATVQPLLELHKQAHAEHAWIGVADAQGTVRAATGGLLVGRSVGERDWFRAATERRFVGDVHPAKLLAALLPKPSDGETTRFVDFAAPIRDLDGRLRGVVGGHVDWRWVVATLARVREQNRLPADVETLVIDRKGEVIYPHALLGQRISLPPQRQGRSEMARWSDGREYASAVAEVRSGGSEELGWRIVMRQPAASALAPVYSQLLLLLLLGLGATLVCGSAAFLLARRLGAPLRELARVAQRLAAGDREAHFNAEGSSRELQQLGGSLRAMTEGLLAKEHELELANQRLEQAVRERTRELEQANAELERLATRDGLTGVYNRRWFDTRLRECLASAQRTGRPFALLLVDADHFKRINDTHGHGVGDAVLRLLAGVLIANTRGTDFVARIGGEEFAVLLPETADAADAQVLAAKLRSAVAATEFPSVGRITVSGGLALSAPGELGEAGAAALQARADSALYRAKAAGRDRVELQT